MVAVQNTLVGGIARGQTSLIPQHETEHKLSLRGFEMECRDYDPHITLGYEVLYDIKLWSFKPFGETMSKIELMKLERVDGKLTYTAIYSKLYKTYLSCRRCCLRMEL